MEHKERQQRTEIRMDDEVTVTYEQDELRGIVRAFGSLGDGWIAIEVPEGGGTIRHVNLSHARSVTKHGDESSYDRQQREKTEADR
jgi:hypothetical protein